MCDDKSECIERKCEKCGVSKLVEAMVCESATIKRGTSNPQTSGLYWWCTGRPDGGVCDTWSNWGGWKHLQSQQPVCWQQKLKKQNQKNLKRKELILGEPGRMQQGKNKIAFQWVSISIKLFVFVFLTAFIRSGSFQGLRPSSSCNDETVMRCSFFAYFGRWRLWFISLFLLPFFQIFK